MPATCKRRKQASKEGRGGSRISSRGVLTIPACFIIHTHNTSFFCDHVLSMLSFLTTFEPWLSRMYNDRQYSKLINYLATIVVQQLRGVLQHPKLHPGSASAMACCKCWICCWRRLERLLLMGCSFPPCQHFCTLSSVP